MNEDEILRQTEEERAAFLAEMFTDIEGNIEQIGELANVAGMAQGVLDALELFNVLEQRVQVLEEKAETATNSISSNSNEINSSVEQLELNIQELKERIEELEGGTTEPPVETKNYKPYWIYGYADQRDTWLFSFSDDNNQAAPFKIINNGQEYTSFSSNGGGTINGNTFKGYKIGQALTGEIFLQGKVGESVIETKILNGQIGIKIYDSVDLNTQEINGEFTISTSEGDRTINKGLNQIEGANSYTQILFKEI